MNRGWGYSWHQRALKKAGQAQVEAQNTRAAFWGRKQRTRWNCLLLERGYLVTGNALIY